PRATRNPEPRAAADAPSPVVMRRPGPAIDPDPRPAVRTHRSPVAVLIRAPSGSGAGVPDVSVGLGVLPRAVLIERLPVRAQLLREIRRRARGQRGGRA